jgi:hypothetical protein
MLKVEISGVGKLQKTLADAQRAIESLNGELVTLRVDPNNPQAAVREMERAVDTKLAQYRGNSLVEKIAKASKEHFRKRILEGAESRRRAVESGAK